MTIAALETTPIADRHTLVAENLVKSYRHRRVVDGVNIHIDKGEIVGLLGPNGAGKTTTFYMIVGLVRPESGTICFKGGDITRYPVYRRARSGLGYLAQEPSIFRRLTVEQNIMAILETLPLSRAERKQRLHALLGEFNLVKVARQRAYTLSGGERRKLEIARALVQNPAILLLDEPFAGVDPLAVSDIQQIVRDLQASGYGILITDHNVRETLSVVDRAYLLYEGRVLCEGTSQQLIDDPEVRKRYLGEEFRM
ncbi:MAG: LPS export ABC transporter ATP-binding protein [Kiritimatiellia bacterium]|jgi:lipopolysaccharide export system ATP-binding protein